MGHLQKGHGIAFADLDEYALLHQAAGWVRGDHLSPRPVPGDGCVTRGVADGWRAILLRHPRWHAEREVHAEQASPDWPQALLAELGEPEPGRVVLDLVGVDARPGAGRPDQLAIERRDGGRGPSLEDALARLPAWSLVGRRYMKLTEAQLRAVEHDGRNLQLIACAGSGKTEVVSRRVVHLLTPGRSDSLTPRNIIAFTFTEKAAAELKVKLRQELEKTLQGEAGPGEHQRIAP